MNIRDLIIEVRNNIECFEVNEEGEEYSNYENMELDDGLKKLAYFLNNLGLLDTELSAL